jgi:hypothetical protein
LFSIKQKHSKSTFNLKRAIISIPVGIGVFVLVGFLYFSGLLYGIQIKKITMKKLGNFGSG